MTYVKPTWSLALPRPQFKQFESLPSLNRWFDIYKLPSDVIVIHEPHHFQEVMSFLILGDKRALLLDTGMGLFDIKAEVKNLTNLPVVVVNSHTHFDHIGDDWRFDEVNCLNQPDAIQALSYGYDIDATDQNLLPEAFDFDGQLPDLSKYSFRPAQKVVAFQSGAVFNLGNRKLEAIATPGHSTDSVVLVDYDNKMLFMGDSFYPASLYAYFMPGDDRQNLHIYRNTIADLASRFGDFMLYCSHNEPLVPGTKLRDLKQAFDQILDGTATGKPIVDGLKFYQFDGFGVETRV